MKHKLIISLTTLVAVMFMVAFAVGNGTPQVTSADEGQTENTVVVTGTGTIEVEPDIAIINIGVQTQNDDAQIAQQENAAAMDKVISALKTQGIAEKDIVTSQYNIYQSSNYLDGEMRKEFFVVNNTVNVTVREVKQVGKLIDLASANGANSINNITFSVSDDAAYYQEALKLAMGNAEGKAEAIMGTFSKTPGQPINVTEYSSGGGVIYAAESVKTFAMDAVSTPIETGQISISASVTVTYGY